MALSLTHACLPYPIKHARFSFLVTWRDTTGAITNPTAPDSEYSTDGGATFNDCAEEVNPVGGHGYLTVTGAESNYAAVKVQLKGTGVLTEVVDLYPRDLPVLTTGTAQGGGASTITLQAGSSTVNDYYNGCIVRTTGGTGGGGVGGADNQARVITDYVGGTLVATVEGAWETQPANDTTYDILVPETWEQAAGVRTLLALPAVTPDTSGGLSTEDANGRISANVTAISDDSDSADNLETATDGGAYNVGGGAIIAASVTGAVGSVTGAVGSVSGGIGGSIAGNVVGSVGSVVGAVGSVTGAVGSVTGNVGGNVVGSVSSVTGAVGSVTGDVGGNVVGSVGSVVGSVGSVTGAVGSVTGDVGGNVVGSVGSVTGAVGSVTGDVGGNVVGSVGSVTGAVGSVTGDVGGNVVGSVSSVTGNVVGSVGSVVGAVGSVTAAVTVGTNNDKTGYSITGTLTTLDALWTKVKAWLRLALRKDAGIVADHAVEVAEINQNMGSGAGAYANTTDSQEAIRDNEITSAGVSAAVGTRAVEGIYTYDQLMRIISAALAGKVSGGGTATVTFRSLDDTANRIQAVVTVNGDRTAVTLTP